MPENETNIKTVDAIALGGDEKIELVEEEKNLTSTIIPQNPANPLVVIVDSKGGKNA